MDSVYVLSHCYELENTLEEKLIGVYSSDASAKAAIERLKNAPGFSEHPAECFYIDTYRIDEDNWANGFYTV
jgi:homoserine kinase type II